MDTVVGVASDRGLIRRFVRDTAFLAEIHIEICQILDNQHIVLGGKASDDLQLTLGKTHPRGVVGVGKEHSRDTTCLEMAFQFRLQCFPPETGNIETIHAHTNDLALLLLDGETRVDKKDGITLFVELGHRKIESKSRLHTAHSRDNTIIGNVKSDECTDEFTSPMFNLGNTCNNGVMSGIAIKQCLMFGFDTDLLGRQTGFAQLHVDKLFAGSALDVFDYAHELANRGITEFVCITQTEIHTGLINQLFVQGEHSLINLIINMQCIFCEMFVHGCICAAKVVKLFEFCK